MAKFACKVGSEEYGGIECNELAELYDKASAPARYDGYDGRNDEDNVDYHVIQLLVSNKFPVIPRVLLVNSL